MELRSERDRIAVVVSGTLKRMQVSRILRDPRCRVFENNADALIWLDGPGC